MPDYRIYLLNAGHGIHGVHEVEAADDTAALADAARVVEDHPAAEVWQRERLVGQVRGRTAC
jgi:hypothetical protein